MEQTTKADARAVDDVGRLTAEVEALRARLETLEAGARPNGNGNGNGHHAPQTRRDLLKLAGAAAAGAAGSIVLGAVPAAATNTQPIILGNQTTNDAATTTDIFPTNATTPAPLFQATGQGVSTTTTVPPTASSNPNAPLSQSIPLIGAIGPGGHLPPIGTAVADYPGFAPIQGVGGTTTITTSTGQKPVSEGVNGFGFGATGIGITGESDVGYGVVGGSGGIDFAALGNGRILQLALPNAMLASAPAGPPNYVPNDFELVRDANGLLYASLPGGAWVPLQFGGLNKSVFTAVTRKLLALAASDGATFMDMMPDGTQGLTGGPDLVLSITPAFDCYALITGSASLYTDTAGYGQDIGIFVSGSTGPQGIVTWAESGGLAANTPNAAYVEAIVPLFRGVAYDVRLKWKGQRAANATIRSGAGPFPITAGLTNVSPTRISAVLLVNP
jgi:hypothetical protein